MTVGEEVTEGGARDDDGAAARVSAWVWVSADGTCVNDDGGSKDDDDGNNDKDDDADDAEEALLREV